MQQECFRATSPSCADSFQGRAAATSDIVPVIFMHFICLCIDFFMLFYTSTCELSRKLLMKVKIFAHDMFLCVSAHYSVITLTGVTQLKVITHKAERKQNIPTFFLQSMQCREQKNEISTCSLAVETDQ